MSSGTRVKSKGKSKKKNKPLVPKWKLFRANEPLLSVFMWGVNHTVRELQHVAPPMLLMPDDFKAFSKVKIDNQSFNKDHMPSHFKIKEYCPNVFRNLRERFGVDEQEYVDTGYCVSPSFTSTTLLLDKGGPQFTPAISFCQYRILPAPLKRWLTCIEPRWLSDAVDQHVEDSPPPPPRSDSTPPSPTWRQSSSNQQPQRSPTSPTTPSLTTGNRLLPTTPLSTGTFLDKLLHHQQSINQTYEFGSQHGSRHWLISYNRKLLVRVTHKQESVERMMDVLRRYHQRSLTWSEAEPEESAGRSGSKFYRSYDEKFMIKTMSAEEIAEVHSSLRQYHCYVVEKHGKTLLPQYLGMYRTTVDGTETYLIVMRNILGRKYPVHVKYDLKGSTVQRAASDKEKAKDLPTFKDNDFLEGEVTLNLPVEAETKLLDMLESDTKFLAKLNLMDYSLLVGIHDCDKFDAQLKEEAAQGVVTGESSGGEGIEEEDEDQMSQPTPPDSPIPSTGAFAPILNTGEKSDLDHEFYAINSKTDAPKREVYFIGLVDILTYYGVKKRTATAAKSVKYGAEADYSTIAPEAYGKRMVDFVARHILRRRTGKEEEPGNRKSAASRTHSGSHSQGADAK